MQPVTMQVDANFKYVMGAYVEGGNIGHWMPLDSVVFSVQVLNSQSQFNH